MRDLIFFLSEGENNVTRINELKTPVKNSAANILCIKASMLATKLIKNVNRE